MGFTAVTSTALWQSEQVGTRKEQSGVLLQNLPLPFFAV